MTMKAVAAAAAAMMIMVVALPPGSAAQTSCVSSLIPCTAYLNTTSTPPATCCAPLKQALKDELPCICGLFDNKEFLAQFNVTTAMIDNLATACGVTNLNICSAPAQAPTLQGSKTGAASRTDWIGFSCLTSLIIFWCSMFMPY